MFSWRLPTRNNSRASSEYRYGELDLTTNAIRVFQIDQPLVESEIFLTLSQQNVNAGPYTCISYAWGCPEPVYQINIRTSGQKRYSKIDVRENLYEFLQTATTLQVKTKLWVDAICISQTSTKERNHQVQRMSEIFSAATEVLVWPGPLFAESEQTLALSTEDLLNFKGELLLLNSAAEQVVGQDHSYSNVRQNRLQLGRNAAANDDVPPLLLKLRQSAYWDRQWIIQELLLPDQLRVIIGSRLLPFSELAAIYNKYNWSSTLGRGKDIPQAERRLDHGSHLDNFCQKFQNTTRGRHYGLGQCMSFSSRTQCLDWRDKVYSMTGLCPALHGLPVNYDADEPTLILDVSFHVRPESLSELLALLSNLAVAISFTSAFLCSKHTASHFKHRRTLQDAIAPDGSFEDYSPNRSRTNRAMPSATDVLVYVTYEGVFLGFPNCRDCSNLVLGPRSFPICWVCAQRVSKDELLLRQCRCSTDEKKGV